MTMLNKPSSILLAVLSALLLLANGVASAAAFNPKPFTAFGLQKIKYKKTRPMSDDPPPFEKELGAQPPLGFWDPLELVADGDKEKFDRLRYVEIKHGRIAMLAVVGYLVTEAGWRLPVFSDLPCGFEALNAVPSAGINQILLTIGLLETEIMKDVTGKNEFVGDFRNGSVLDFGWDTFDDATKLKKRAIELNQGRAAMMGILALMVHEKLGVSLLPASVKIEIIMKEM